MGKWVGILAAVVFGWAAWAGAHPIIIGDGDSLDWDPAGWQLDPPVNLNTGHIARDDSSQGEYIWNDLLNDERNEGLFTPYPRLDIDEFRITSDPNYLYFMIRMNMINPGEWGVHGSPMVQIAIDLQPDWPGYTEDGHDRFWTDQEASVHPDALWDYLLVTRFGSNSPQPYLFYWNDLWIDYSTPQVQEVILPAPNNSIEIEIPWSLIGGIPAVPLTFTVVTYQSDVTDQVIPILFGPAAVADIMDAVTNYGDPGSVGGTELDSGDGVLDYHFQVWFHLDPNTEPSPPLVVNEVKYENTPFGGQWIEIFNRTGIDGFDIYDYKLGDEETVDDMEYMAGFPAGATAHIGICNTVVVADNATDYLSYYGVNPDFEINASSAVSDMVIYWNWTPSTPTFFLAAGGDEVLMLDPYDTVIDVVAYEFGTYPGVVTYPEVTTGSIERLQKLEDTNDATVDMVNSDPETPGNVSCRTPSHECEIGVWDPATCCFSPAGSSCTDQSATDCYDARCDGAGVCVQNYAVESAGYVCRDLAGVCDVAESCTGSSGNCPPDGFLDATTVCRNSTGVCDPVEYCPGTGADCPMDAYATTDTVCRTAAGDCDVADYCDGTAVDCPADTVASIATECRPAAGACDVPEYCDGISVDCPGDYVEPATTVCRESVDICDVAEYCSGITATCPDDTFESAITLCRTEAGICDIAEYCSGITSACPADYFEPVTTVCREAEGVCDETEYCSGVSAECPVDVFVAAGTLCNDDDDCTEGTVCDGEGLCSGGVNICEEMASGCDSCSMVGGAGSSTAPLATWFLMFGMIGLVLRRLKR